MKIKTAGFLTALTVFFSVFSAAPITVSAEYAGTAYTFEDFVINYESGGLKNGEWTKQTDDGVYLRFSAKWYDLKTVPGGGFDLSRGNARLDRQQQNRADRR